MSTTREEVEIRPVRLQLRRTAGFNLQRLSKDHNGLPAKGVARPGLWGNPFTIKGAIEAGYLKPKPDEVKAHRCCVESFEEWLRERTDPRARWMMDNLDQIRGVNLACWCAPPFACHADVLLKVANKAAALRAGVRE